MKTGRNQPCPCGSGKKFKKCCGSRATPTPPRQPGANLNIATAVKTATKHYDAGRLQQAADIFMQILEAEPNNVEVLRILGEIAFQTNSYEMATGMYQRLAAIKPDEPVFYNALGHAFHKANRLDEAVADEHPSPFDLATIHGHEHPGVADQQRRHPGEATRCPLRPCRH